MPVLVHKSSYVVAAVQNFVHDAQDVIVNLAGLLFLLWVLGQVIRGMFKGGR